MIGRALAVIGLAAIGFASTAAAAQEQARIEWKTFHSRAMEGNLEGNPAERGAFVVTPPGYDENPTRHYPTVYFLHGYFATPQMYQDMMAFEEAVDEAAAAGNEVIMVIPDGFSKYRGGFYSNSVTTGNYEGFVGEDLVNWVDANYRTIPERDSRGLSGHSMGGYGTLRLAMKYPDTFSSIYAMSSCCLTPQPPSAEAAARVEAMSAEEMANAGFGELAPISTYSTWSPDPSNPPHYWYTGLKEDGTIDPLVEARFAANAPVVMLSQYVPALKSYEAIQLDIGDQDFLMQGNLAMKAELERFGIPFGWEVYEGDHGNRIKDRIRSHVLPFFGQHLDKD
ncbi:MAG TPA: alpha/beta hydrolase-fold protein [Sphingomonadaceae bacterium]|nr:alpha/beta hydrolase-fold protein [Sphingomonadaceae bacterium]